MPPDVFLADNIRRICVSGTIHHKYLPDTWVFALKKYFLEGNTREIVSLSISSYGRTGLLARLIVF